MFIEANTYNYITPIYEFGTTGVTVGPEGKCSIFITLPMLKPTTTGRKSATGSGKTGRSFANPKHEWTCLREAVVQESASTGGKKGPENESCGTSLIIACLINDAHASRDISRNRGNLAAKKPFPW